MLQTSRSSCVLSMHYKPPGQCLSQRWQVWWQCAAPPTPTPLSMLRADLANGSWRSFHWAQAASSNPSDPDSKVKPTCYSWRKTVGITASAPRKWWPGSCLTTSTDREHILSETAHSIFRIWVGKKKIFLRVSRDGTTTPSKSKSSWEYQPQVTSES